MKIPKVVKEFADVFHRNNHSLFIVGGAVRDQLLGNRSSDYDFATDAEPSEVIRMFSHVIPTGIEHGTVTVLFKGNGFEVTTFRTEAGYSDARHPDSIEFVRDLDEDLSRRDFTINALTIDTIDHTLIDMHHGLEDLKARLIRAIGDPRRRFAEDSLRILRGYRFISTLGFDLEEQTRAAAAELAHTISSVSCERIREEFNKILTAQTPSRSFFALQEQGILAYLIPELSQCAGVGQKGAHAFDVFTHSVLACDGAPRGDRIIRWAALLHDIGKPGSMSVDSNGIPSFHQHEFLSADMADLLLQRLKFSNQDRLHIVHLIRQHMFHYTPEFTDAAVRRFIARVGAEYIEDLFTLRRADAYGTSGVLEENLLEAEFRERIAACLKEEQALRIQDLKIDGRDLMGIGVRQGPIIGWILHELLETVLDNPSNNTRDRLLHIAQRLWEEQR